MPEPIVATLLLCSLACGGVAAQDDSAEAGASASDIARELANPNSTLGFLAFPVDYIEYEGTAPGASNQSALKLSFQPSFPYPLNESTNLFIRPLIPIYIDQPVPLAIGQPPSFGSVGPELGDLSFDAAIGKTFESGMVMIAGVVGTLNTGTDDSISINQNLLGPEFFIGRGTSWGFYGVLLNHQWDIGGTDAYETSITGGQYFFTFNLENAWQIQMQPTFSYDHNADSGDKLTFPIGIGLSKTKVLGKTPWKFALQYWHYTEQNDTFGPRRQIRFQFAPVIPLPW